MASAARVLLDAGAQHTGLWGDVQVKLTADDNSTVTTSCTVDPIPNVRDLFYHHELAMLIAWCIGGACALAALALCFQHLISFRTQENTARRRYFTGVVLMAPVFAVTNYLSMFFPRAAALFELVQHVYEAQALWSFGMLIYDLASDGETDQVLAREILLAKLALCEPKKLDASPPLCFLAPFVKPVRVDGRRLDSIMEGLKVFGIVVPACAVVRLWITVEAKNVGVIYGSQVGLLLLENLAMSYTLYNLFQLYVCTHDLLHHYRTTDKFVAIKAVLGIAVLQDMIIKTVVKKYLKPSYFSSDMKSEFWADFALTVEAIILALAHKSAYPVEELKDGKGVYAAKRAAAREHAMELLALPQGPHGAPAPEDEEAPAAAVVELGDPAAPKEAWAEGDHADAAWPQRNAGAPALEAPPAAAAPTQADQKAQPAPQQQQRRPPSSVPGSDWSDTDAESEAAAAQPTRK